MGKKYLFNSIEGTFDIVAGEDDYLQASKANDQTNFDTGDDVIFDTVDRSAGLAISLNTSTGVFTLKAGKTYELTCGIRYEHTTATRIGFAWYNITNSVEISMRARIMNMKETGDYSNLPITQAIITPDVDTQVTVRCVWEGDGIEDVNAGHTWVIIKKISESIYNVIDTPSIEEENCLLALSTSQLNLTTNTTINLVDNVVGFTINNNIVFNNGTHRATLKAGKTYKLQANLRIMGGNFRLAYRWYNITQAEYIGIQAYTYTINYVATTSSQQLAQAIITPTSDIEVELRCTLATSGVDVYSDASSATIEKISEVALTQATVGSTDTKLQRVDNDAWETAQDGVEYYSPIQNGRKHGIVYRQYFATSLPSDLTSGNNVSRLIDFSLLGHSGANRYMTRGISSDGTNMFYIVLIGISGNSNLLLTALGWFNGNVTNGWVDYTK